MQTTFLLLFIWSLAWAIQQQVENRLKGFLHLHYHSIISALHFRSSFVISITKCNKDSKLYFSFFHVFRFIYCTWQLSCARGRKLRPPKNEICAKNNYRLSAKWFCKNRAILYNPLQCGKFGDFGLKFGRCLLNQIVSNFSICIRVVHEPKSEL